MCGEYWLTFSVAKRAKCALRTPPPANANTNDNNLISAVEDFSPPSSPMPMDFTDKSDVDETFLESGRSFLFELIV